MVPPSEVSRVWTSRESIWLHGSCGVFSMSFLRPEYVDMIRYDTIRRWMQQSILYVRAGVLEPCQHCWWMELENQSACMIWRSHAWYIYRCSTQWACQRPFWRACIYFNDYLYVWDSPNYYFSEWWSTEVRRKAYWAERWGLASWRPTTETSYLSNFKSHLKSKTWHDGWEMIRIIEYRFEWHKLNLNLERAVVLPLGWRSVDSLRKWMGNRLIPVIQQFPIYLVGEADTTSTMSLKGSVYIAKRQNLVVLGRWVCSADFSAKLVTLDDSPHRNTQRGLLWNLRNHQLKRRWWWRDL